MHTTSLISKAAVRPAALTFHCTVIPGSTNSGVEHSHKMQHHSPVRSPAETAEYRLMCSTEPICMGSGESADVRRGDAEEGERKEDEPVFLLRSWRKQAGLVCIVWVTFVKWALLFQLLHYSNTCYWDHWRAHWHQCGVRLSHRVDLGGGRGGECAFVLGVKAIDTYVTKWGLKRLWHLPPILTMHSDVRPQLVMRSVRTCRNKDTSRCVCVCLGTSHCEPQGQNSATCAGAGVPTAAETRVHQLDLLPLWVWSEGERRDTTGQWEGSVVMLWLSQLFFHPLFYQQ